MTDLTSTLTLAGNTQIKGVAGLTTPSDFLPIGQAGVWPEMKQSFTFGTGNGKANMAYWASRVLGAGANDDLDLSGGLGNTVGDSAIIFTGIKKILIAIDTPDGVKKLRIGPQGAANAAQLNFGGITAPCYREITDWALVLYNPWGNGYPITAATADILRINNPGAGSVTYRILIEGIA